MNRKEFFSLLPEDITANELDYIKSAYWLSKLNHKGQMRDTGERYFEHPRRVACRLIKYPAARAYLVSEVVMGLLHDTEEDSYPPEGLIERLFGPNIYRGLTTLSNQVIEFDPLHGGITKTKKSQKDYYDKIAEDPWPSIRRVKIFDRLDNLLSMGVWTKSRQLKYIKDTRENIIPLGTKTDPKLEDLLVKTCNTIEKILKR